MALKSVVGWSIVALVFVPFTASAQEEGGIAGVVRDASGGVLPGTTVEAASPVLIERVRTVFTDSEGRYSIVDLRPGVYTVTFTLPGFATVIREGVELTTGFTATVSPELASWGHRGDDYGNGADPAGRRAERPPARGGDERAARDAADQHKEYQ